MRATSPSVRTIRTSMRRGAPGPVDGPAAGQERGRPGDEVIRIEQADPLGVDVAQLLQVEERGRRADVLQPVEVDDLADRPHLDARRVAPSRAGRGS